MPMLIWRATRGVMEILGLVPFQSETQYLEQIFRVIAEWQQGGNMLPLRCHSAATNLDQEATKRQHSPLHVRVFSRNS